MAIIMLEMTREELAQLIRDEIRAAMSPTIAAVSNEDDDVIDSRPTGGRTNTPQNLRWRFILRFMQSQHAPLYKATRRSMGRQYISTRDGIDTISEACDKLSATLSGAKAAGWMDSDGEGNWWMTAKFISFRDRPAFRNREVTAEDIAEEEERSQQVA